MKAITMIYYFPKISISGPRRCPFSFEKKLKKRLRIRTTDVLLLSNSKTSISANENSTKEMDECEMDLFKCKTNLILLHQLCIIMLLY